MSRDIFEQWSGFDKEKKMICYKDKTFCDQYKTCSKGKDCDRALTDKVKKDAQEFGLGICSYVTKPKCYRRKL